MSGRSHGCELDWNLIWSEYGQAYTKRVSDFSSGADSIERELVFCLLGGYGISFALARSALAVIIKLDVFNPNWEPRDLEEELFLQLSGRQFEPRRRNGTLRTYRFPRRKARLLASAAGWINQHPPLQTELMGMSSEESRRQYLCTCPGVGLKTASWLLRNSGLARAIAVLDVHVVRALRAAGRIVGGKLPRDYFLMERAFLAWCRELDASPAAFDLLLWDCLRAR